MWWFTTKVDEENKVLIPTKSTILINFDYSNAEHGPCPGALPAFFGACGVKPVLVRYV